MPRNHQNKAQNADDKVTLENVSFFRVLTVAPRSCSDQVFQSVKYNSFARGFFSPSVFSIQALIRANMTSGLLAGE